MVNTRHKHVKLDLTSTSHVSQQYHNVSDGIHSVPHLHGIKSRKRQIDEGKTHKYGSSNHYRRWIHSIVQSHSQERRKNAKTPIPKIRALNLQPFFSPNFQLNTQSLNFPLLTNVSSSRLILRILLWLLLLLSSKNTTTNISSTTLGTTIHNRLVETERHQGETHEYSSLLWGQARHKGLAFTRYPFVSQQLELPKPLYLPKMRGPTLILAQSGARWEFPPHQPQPVGLVPTVSFVRADSSNS